jgi:Tfp pilus assembly protein PilV
MRTRSGVRLQRGFSMIDALIGLMLLGIVLVGFLTAFRHATMGTASNTARTQATFIAQDVLERIKNHDNEYKTVSKFTDLLNSPSVIPTSVTRGNMTYRVGASIVNAPAVTGTLVNALVPVQVNVSWTENGAAKVLRMVNYYYTQSTPLPAATPGASATATPKPTATPGYAVHYEVSYQWNTGATINVTIKNNSLQPINGWTLVWNFSGNQKITGLWNGSYEQSGKTATVKNAGWNAQIPANSGEVSFRFNLSYMGTNASPTAFKLNGIPCSIY